MPREIVLSDAEIEEIRALGDNTGCMVLKGGSAAYTEEPVADRWPLDADLAQVAERWSIDPAQALTYDHANV